jgi:hypothetical protein
MTENTYINFDIIIIIILAFLVAFIIGFNIIQIIDNKLNSVIINVPPQNCNMRPIYLNIDGSQVLISDAENTDKLDKNTSRQTSADLQKAETNKSNNDVEGFGNIPDKISNYEDSHVIASQNSVKFAKNSIDTLNNYETAKDPNYNTLNNLPLLLGAKANGEYQTPDNPNQVTKVTKSYYTDRVKLVNDTNSPLLKLAESNKNKINQAILACQIKNSNNDNYQQDEIPNIENNTENKIENLSSMRSYKNTQSYDGYNAFVDLRHDSYANITAIGKSLMTPYISFPIPS